MLKTFIVRTDTTLTNAMTNWPAWLRGPMLVITNLGHPATMCLIAGLIMFMAWQRSEQAIAYGLAIGTFAMLANTLLKHFIHRTRPDTLYASQMYFKTSSFPSGHAFGVASVGGLMLHLSLMHLATPWGAIVSWVVGAFILLVGISRVYLGAHYPTDVLAGWLLGGGVATLVVGFLGL